MMILKNPPMILLLAIIAIGAVNAQNKCKAKATHHAFEVEAGEDPVFKIRCSDLRNMAFDFFPTKSEDGQKLRETFCEKAFTNAKEKCPGVCESDCDSTCINEPKECRGLSVEEACDKKKGKEIICAVSR